jgi:hypothetical protein
MLRAKRNEVEKRREKAEKIAYCQRIAQDRILHRQEKERKAAELAQRKQALEEKQKQEQAEREQRSEMRKKWFEQERERVESRQEQYKKQEIMEAMEFRKSMIVSHSNIKIPANLRKELAERSERAAVLQAAAQEAAAQEGDKASLESAGPGGLRVSVNISGNQPVAPSSAKSNEGYQSPRKSINVNMSTKLASLRDSKSNFGRTSLLASSPTNAKSSSHKGETPVASPSNEKTTSMANKSSKRD